MSAFQTFQSFFQALYSPNEVVALMFSSPDSGKVQHAFVPASSVTTEEFFHKLQTLNETFNIYVGMNPFRPELAGQNEGRTKKNVAEVKRLYVDADTDGAQVVDRILKSGKVPPPTVVLESSPGKFQMIWNATGLTQETAEPLMKAMAEEFQSDPAVAEIARVLRVPGFRNWKYIDAPKVKAVSINSGAIYDQSAFHFEMKTDGEKFKSKPEGWINEPIVHGNINNRLTAIAGYYIGEKFVKDADVLFELLKGHAERQAVHKDGVTPFQCNMNEVRKIADGCISRYKTKKLELTQTAAPVAAGQPATVTPIDVSDWRAQFRSVGEMDDGPIVEVIHGVLQEGICFLGASPSDGKTLVSLSMAKAISTGQPLFGLSQFSVPEPRCVIYLIPESRDRAFRKRCEAFRIPDDKTKFMARTISSGPTLPLDDLNLLQAVKETKAVVILDTAVRFMKGADENSAAQNRLLVNDVITLLANGAVCVVLAHHATKASPNEPMTQENMLRGTSDFAAMCDQIYGIRKDRNLYDNGEGPMELDLVNLKDREQIGELTKIRLAASRKGRGDATPTSIINSTGDFSVVDKEMNRQRSAGDLLAIVKADVLITVKELVRKTGASEYEIESQLRSAGWHRVKGGKEGASPWHQDVELECPYGKPISMSKVLPVDRPKKPSMKDAIMIVRELLSSTSESQTIPMERVYEAAKEKGLTDTQVEKARKEVKAEVGEDGGLYLPEKPSQPQEPTEQAVTAGVANGEAF